MDLGLAGRSALVTGASSGIGRAIARSLALEGVRCLITARRLERLNELADEVAALGGVAPVPLQADALADDYPATVADAALAALGKVEIIFNNAGGSRAFDLATGDAQWDEAITLNFTRHRRTDGGRAEQGVALERGHAAICGR